MKLYHILLVLFIFGFVCAGINESGIFSHQIPETSIGFNQSDVQEITEGVEGIGTNPFSALASVFLFFRVFASAVLAIITILPILSSWGVPLWAGMMVQGPVWLVEVVGFYQLATGHIMGGME